MLKKSWPSTLWGQYCFFSLKWHEYNFPTTVWKEAYVLCIHKRNKNTTDPTNYQPISLTNIFFIRLWQKSISSAFTSTIDNLLYLQEIIHLSYNRKQRTSFLWTWKVFRTRLTKIFSKQCTLNVTKKQRQVNLQLTLYKKPLNQVMETTFLVLNLDRRFRWTSHCINLIGMLYTIEHPQSFQCYLVGSTV